MTLKYWNLLTSLLCFQTLAKAGLCIPTHGISIWTILSLKSSSLNFRQRRDLRYPWSQLIVNLIANKIKYSASFEFDPDGSKIHMDFKIAFHYKLNTMLYRKCQFILTFRISLFFLQFIYWALKIYWYLFCHVSIGKYEY